MATTCYLLLALSVMEFGAPFSAIVSRMSTNKKMNFATRSSPLLMSSNNDLVDDQSAFPTETTNESDDVEIDLVEDESTKRIKDELLELASITNRGFSASRKQKDEARKLCDKLRTVNPTQEPLYPYYAESEKLSGEPSLAGKWTLVYTDAPDITTLDSGPLSAAKLGRIGQECDPPLIKNVIEWLKPDWAANLPFSTGAGKSRVLQKVCTEASASPSNPFRANLKVVGLDLVGDTDGNSGNEGTDENKPSFGPFPESPAKFFEDNPLELRGPLKTPFGSFEVLYLDEDLRIIKTYQGFLAVNTRQKSGEEWFY